MQYAVLYEARANSGIDRMSIINAVAKSVPEPHKVDLTSPDKTIIVEIVKVYFLLPSYRFHFLVLLHPSETKFRFLSNLKIPIDI